jgi:hypothetical protein
MIFWTFSGCNSICFLSSIDHFADSSWSCGTEAAVGSIDFKGLERYKHRDLTFHRLEAIVLIHPHVLPLRI